ncbi:hypothetical protein [Halomonas sp. E19]|uniref:hypothetical protein n=1 Tax=Halomonas sp. E19 TaxID=3397247 RepID=UPI004034D01F
MEQLNVALAVVGGLVMVVGLLSSPLDRSWLSAPLFAFLFGVALGPLAWKSSTRPDGVMAREFSRKRPG